MISELSFNEQSLLMARLSALAYNDHQTFEDYGYDSVFLDVKGSQAYVLWNNFDLIIVCRGTQPNQLSDIIADIRFHLVPSSSGVGEVHAGFKHSVDLLWPTMVKLIQKYSTNRKMWCTGHSLGAAMATLITARCHRLDLRGVPNPVLFTYGSPRVGNSEYRGLLRSLNIEHHRWVNNADIVTRNPILPYKHHGTLHYFNHYGQVSNVTRFRLVWDRILGTITGIKKGKINFFVNHLIDNYIKNLENLQ